MCRHYNYKTAGAVAGALLAVAAVVAIGCICMRRVKRTPAKQTYMTAGTEYVPPRLPSYDMKETREDIGSNQVAHHDSTGLV